MSNFTKKKFVHILHRQSFFKGKLKMQGNYCISAGDSKLSVEMLVIDEIVPTLLHALEDDETSDTALDGLKQILRIGYVGEKSYGRLAHRFFRGYHNGMSGAYISYGNEDCIEESFGMEFQVVERSSLHLCKAVEDDGFECCILLPL
ncbi:uncharacterized protein LOC108319721 isoform X2 [Vigna angularis]|uniref:uncharacterized protein LOC108319721 isoform X2 n=1 Tax=Phaseolus angularis TaxID=3914 RepID=UPI0022B2BFE9|nr:uncharacterized protein LOC108319721 isoform X2 [Vigna angularis]